MKIKGYGMEIERERGSDIEREKERERERILINRLIRLCMHTSDDTNMYYVGYIDA